MTAEVGPEFGFTALGNSESFIVSRYVDQTHRTFLWDGQTDPVAVGSFSLSAFAEPGAFVGHVGGWPDGPPRAVRWVTGETPQELDLLSGGTWTQAFAVNGSGIAVGKAGTDAPGRNHPLAHSIAYADVQQHAVLWDVGGSMTDLGTLGGDYA